MGLQKLLVNAAAEKGRHGNIKFCRIHVIDQVHQHLLGTSLPKIMDEEENFYHDTALLLIMIYYRLNSLSQIDGITSLLK